MTQNQTSSRIPKSFALSLMLGATLVVPFFALEWVNRRAFNEEFPLMLFTFMSIHALLIGLLLAPVLQCLQAQRNLRTLKIGHWVGLLFAIFLIYGYVGVLIDQFPCFMGVPNCD